MTERKTCREIIIPSPDKTSASVIAALDTLEKEVGSKMFGYLCSEQLFWEEIALILAS